MAKSLDEIEAILKKQEEAVKSRGKPKDPKPSPANKPAPEGVPDPDHNTPEKPKDPKPPQKKLWEKLVESPSGWALIVGGGIAIFGFILGGIILAKWLGSDWGGPRRFSKPAPSLEQPAVPAIPVPTKNLDDDLPIIPSYRNKKGASK